MCYELLLHNCIFKILYIAYNTKLLSLNIITIY